MAKKMTDTTTFQALEQDAYHAFIEWGLFLVLRIRQLEQHLAATQTPLNTTKSPVNPAQ